MRTGGRRMLRPHEGLLCNVANTALVDNICMVRAWLWLVPSLCLSTTNALLASNGYAHRRAVCRQSLRCSADSDPVSGSAAGNGDDTGGLGDGASMGDLLAALASQQQGALPLEDLVDETRGSIDAMLEFGSDELDEIAYEVRSP